MISSVPLHLRLPNPPAHFTGRAAKLEQLAEAIERAPVTAVWGLGGVGKTTLALATIHRSFTDRVDTTLHLTLANGADPVEEIVRALAVVAGRRMDWREILADPDAVTALAIDLAESVEPAWWLVVDDLHRADPVRANRLLDGFARYARKSRLVVTTRSEPRLDALAGQVLGVGAMLEADLEQLARRMGVSDADARTRAAGAAGSPWRLLSQLRSGDPQGADLGLADDVTEFLAALSPLEAAVPADLLQNLLPTSHSLEALTRQGLLEQGPAGYRVHDVVRGLIPSADVASGTSRAAELVSRAERMDLVLESVRLYLTAGLPDAAAEVARDHLEALLSEGLAPRVWALLESRTEEALASLRLRCAVELGSLEAAQTVRLPTDASLEDHLNWAHAQRFVSSLDVVADLASNVLHRAVTAGDTRIAFEAGLLAARCRVQIASGHSAVAEVEALQPTTAEQRARRDNILAQLMMNVGRSDKAVELSRACLEQSGELSETVIEEVTAGAARVLYMAGLLDEAEHAVRELERRFGRASLSSFHTRSALNTLIHILQDRADLGGVQQILRWYAPLVGASKILGVSVRIANAMQRLLGGDLDGLESTLEESREFARASGSVNSEAMFAAIACRLDTLQGRRHSQAPQAPPDPVLRALCAIWDVQNHIRHDERVDGQSQAALEHRGTTNPELALVSQLIGAEFDLLAGHAAQAAASTARITTELEQRGLVLAWAEASLLRTEALLVAGEPLRAAEVAGRVRARAMQMPSARLVAEAELLEVLCMPSVDPAQLDALAEGASPVAARRACAIAGESPPIDRLDHVVIEAARERLGFSMDVVVRNGDARWGIDLQNTAVWLPGRVISMAQKPTLFRVLEELVRCGGRASKENLVKNVWGVAEYHPLRHDNRLHLAILKIRREIEVDPKHPTHLRSAEDGYELGGWVRCRMPT